ncbi:MAG: methionine--tRNA ligase subunit beta, partial [Candidatus Electryoneaceae bacterium]|nr:methionine--tRNA ligase subunit beta [Candidatus Electryoneaceae bacterium]
SRLSWGIPIPWDHDYVTYVWFDALLNYYTATLTPPDGKQVKWPADYHIIGKDILTTHAVYWPIMLHAAGLEPPKHILAHGWWLAKDDAKMSKSSGNVVKPLDLAGTYGTDAFRYVLMREMVVGQDASFSEESFVQRFNSDLANDLGNLYSRLAKVWKTGGYGAYSFILPEDRRQDQQDMFEAVQSEINALRPHTAIERIMQVVRQLNRFIEHLQPWKVVKTDPDSIRDDLAWALDTVDEVARLLEPVMPTKMADLRGWIRDDSGAINPQVGVQLFPRVKKIKVETAPKPKKKKTKPEITIEDFAKLDLRVGLITSVQRVPDSDKLLAVEVDLGSEKRQVVAGIAEKYDPQSLIGRRVVIVANLKPIKLRGELSHGMMLAAGDKEVIGLVTTLEDVPVGTIIR